MPIIAISSVALRLDDRRTCVPEAGTKGRDK